MEQQERKNKMRIRGINHADLPNCRRGCAEFSGRMCGIFRADVRNFPADVRNFPADMQNFPADLLACSAFPAFREDPVVHLRSPISAGILLVGSR